MEQKRFSVTDWGLCALNLFFFAGQIFLFHACEPMEDGSWMTCHWADMALRGAACVLAVLAVARLLAPEGGLKTGLSVAMIPVSILAIAIPGGLISLCMMDGMRCRALMRPASLVLSILVIAAAAADIFFERKKK